MSFDHLISIDMLRGISTVLAFAAFIAICLWAYSGRRRDDFEQAANLPFADEQDAASEETVQNEPLSLRKGKSS